MIALAVMLAAAAVAAPGDPITWYSMDGGGPASLIEGPYRLGATIGQPDAGTTAGGAYTLRGGFWTGGTARPVGVGETPALSFRFFPTWPNPVRSSSRVAFDLPRATRVVLSVFDVSGRVVRRWDLGSLAAGHQERAWDAVDDDGRRLSSGVYFLRLETDRDRGIHKVIVVR
jgi:hypothetical protein